MKVARLSISNFRGVKEAELHFDGHALIVGANNAGKSTVCEALDLVLGPDRLNRFPAVEEFDFYNSQYLSPSQTEGEPPTSVLIKIEVVLVELSDEVENRCGANTEFWKESERRVLSRGEIDTTNDSDIAVCLRLQTVAKYNVEEDEFEAKTFYSHSPNAEDGQLTSVPPKVKRLFGFLYLRALRTGSRALSLERGSLLDIILRLKTIRTGLWEKAIALLRSLHIEQHATELEPVLAAIEQRLSAYIPCNASGQATKLHVSQLTREHLRKTIAFFLALSPDQQHVPFQQAGAGTLNILVFAMLTFIADLKPETVIFAMEEPEIAIPPHTQRRIADYLLRETSQTFITSHSPYVIERFEPRQTLLLTRGQDGTIETKRISDAGGLRDNDYKRYARRGLTECMLGTGAIVVEGITEFYALPAAARKLEETDQDLQPLDILGVAFFDAESDGNIPKFGIFFKALGLKTFSFYDRKSRKSEEKQKFVDNFDLDCEHPYSGFEELIAGEVPADRLWSFLSDLRASGESGNVGIPSARPDDNKVRELAKAAFQSNKGAGWAARLFERCSVEELPQTVVSFLNQVYSLFPSPPEPLPEEESEVSH